MLDWYYRYFPYFIVEYLALHYCERIKMGNKWYVNPLPGLLIEVPETLSQFRYAY